MLSMHGAPANPTFLLNCSYNRSQGSREDPTSMGVYVDCGGAAETLFLRNSFLITQ
jgi:hypothetical protein